MDFQHLNCVWKLKNFSRTYIELIFIFLDRKFYFQLELLNYFDFQERKTHLISFVFEKLFTGDNRLTSFLFGDQV